MENSLNTDQLYMIAQRLNLQPIEIVVTLKSGRELLLKITTNGIVNQMMVNPAYLMNSYDSEERFTNDFLASYSTTFSDLIHTKNYFFRDEITTFYKDDTSIVITSSEIETIEVKSSYIIYKELMDLAKKYPITDLVNFALI